MGPTKPHMELLLSDAGTPSLQKAGIATQTARWSNGFGDNCVGILQGANGGHHRLHQHLQDRSRGLVSER